MCAQMVGIKNYNGYIMAEADSHEGSSMYHCIGQTLEVVKGTRTCSTLKLLYMATRSGNTLPCVVCTK